MVKNATSQVIPRFFDYFASTPLLSETQDLLKKHYSSKILSANPSSMHAWGKLVHMRIEDARMAIIRSLNLPSNPLIFTSSSTESIHLAILGSMAFYTRPNYHIVTWAIEHPATLAAFNKAKSLGAIIHILNAKDGTIDLDELEIILSNNPIFLISISAIQHELGIINNWENIAMLCKKYGALLHVDASQAIGKIMMDFSQYIPDYMTLSSHKCFAPKGIAALYIGNNRRVTPMLSGGGQQYHWRAGTESLFLIEAMALSYTIIKNKYHYWQKKVVKIDNIFKEIQTKHEIMSIHVANRVPQVLMLSIPNNYKHKWQERIMSSQGSACSHHQGKISNTLLHMGYSRELIASCFRVSWSHMTTIEDIQALHAVFN